MARIDLGCGRNKMKGSIGVDIDRDSDADIFHDLNEFPYPFPNDSADEIVLSHVLEHLEDPERAIRECKRILKVGGRMKVVVPHFSNGDAYADMCHKQFGIMNYYSIKPNGFRIINRKLLFGGMLKWFEPIANRMPRLYQAYLTWYLPCREVVVEAVK